MQFAKDVTDRFWEKVDLSDPSGCWIWKAATTIIGGGRHVKILKYGKFYSGKVDGKNKYWSAHRFSWTLRNGTIPDGLFVDHICHQSLCVNPSHLRLVTPKQNSENRSGPATTKQSSGHRGVRWYNGRWEAYYTHNRVSHYVGRFDTLEDAAKAARQARLSVFTHNDEDRSECAA